MSGALTAERLRQVLAYEPESGNFRWLSSPTASGRRRTRVGMSAGWLENTGYVRITIDGKTYLAHRLAWLYVHGSWPTSELDHRNGRGDDNRIANLRDVTHAKNMQNLVAAHGDSQSGRLGVYPTAGRWAASITVEGRYVWLGRFDTAEQAESAYREAKTRHHITTEVA
jgi:hypothetical protein